MGNEPNWLAAGDVEYRIRPWIIAAIFFAAFQLYQWDHVSAAGALAGWLTPAGGNVHATASLIFWIGAAIATSATAPRRLAVFGSVFSARLTTGLAAALAGAHVPPGFKASGVQANPTLLRRLPPALHNSIRHAYASSLDRVFLYAVPVALVAFVLSWFLREVPLRGAPDIGAGLGAAASGRSSADEVERALSRLASTDIRRRGYERLAALAGLDLPAGSCWVLTRLARQGAVAGKELARQAGVGVDHGGPYVDRLVAVGMVVRADGRLNLTPAGQAAADRLFAARRDGLRALLADWSPEQHAELADLLNHLSRVVLRENADRGLISR